MRPQGMVVRSVGGVEIEGIANDDGQVSPGLLSPELMSMICHVEWLEVS